MLKELPPDKINIMKNTLFFLSRVPTHKNLQFLYKMKHMVHLSQTVSGIFHSRIRLIFMKVYIFNQQKAWTLLTLKGHNSFEKKSNDRKAAYNFTPRSLIFMLRLEV